MSAGVCWTHSPGKPPKQGPPLASCTDPRTGTGAAPCLLACFTGGSWLLLCVCVNAGGESMDRSIEWLA